MVRTGSTVGPDTTLGLHASVPDAEVVRSHAIGAVIGPRAQVGPFAYLRPGTGPRRRREGRRLRRDEERAHRRRLEGAAPVLRRRRRRSASGSNIGAATVFVNYDGVDKHRTVVGDHVRSARDTMLVAPVTVGDGAYTAAGSVITEDVPPGALGVGAGACSERSTGWVDASERDRVGRGAAAEREQRAAAPARRAASDEEPGL